MRFILFVALCFHTWVGPAAALPPVSTSLTALTVSANTGEKPQSKVWSHDGRWWCVMPNSSGTWVWRLDGTTWTNVLQLSSATQTHADVKAIGAVTHVLLFNAAATQLASIEYVPATQTYQAWAARPANVAIALDSGTETATIDADSQGRMWLVTDRAAGTDQIVAYYSDTPYADWNGPLTLATGIHSDDISVVTAFPDGKIGVLWSNQSTQRFGFRTHADGTSPAVWTADEVPASQSALNVGLGMADDHLHVAVASDGTLYAAVKTSYDTAGYPKIALLVRRPAGTWDNLYEVDQAGTRGIALLDEGTQTITVVYTSVEGSGNIIFKESATSSIAFGSSTTLMPGGLNDPMSTKANVSGAVVIVAGSGSALNGVLRSSAAFTITATAGAGGTITPSGAVGVSAGGSQAFTVAANSGYHIADVLVDGLSVGAVASYPFSNVTSNHTISASFAPDVFPADMVGWWRMDGDVTDASSYGNHGTAVGGPTYQTGVDGQALNLSGTGQYVSVPSNASLDITSQITMAAWFRPTKTAFATQRLLQKGVMNSNNGYELSLSSAGKVFVRFNQQSSGDAIRINSATSYPLNGSAWMHAAATFDGTTIRLYVNGVEEGTLTPSPTLVIGTNTTALTIGAMGNFTNLFQGALDDVRLYNRALSSEEVAALAGLATHTITATAGLHGSISPSGSIIVVQGGSQAFTITADPGYVVADVLVDGVSVGTPTSYTFTNVTQSHTIASSFALDAPPAELVGYWPMEEGSGSAILDGSTHANHGSLPNGATWVPGIVGLALSLDGASQRATVPDSPSLDFNHAVTLATWVRPGRMTTQNLIKKSTNGGQDGYELSLATAPPGASGRPFVRFNQTSNGNLHRLDGTQLYPFDGNTWVHLAATYDGSTIRLYVNGVLDSSKAASLTIATNTLPLVIGGQSDGQFPLLGAMDEVRVYGRALDPSEIQALTGGVLDVPSQRPAETQLSAAYPNPSRGSATIGFSLAQAGLVTLRIFGVDGRLVRTLASGRWEAGVHRLVWDGRDDQGHAKAAGIYFAQLTASQGQFTKRISYLR